MEVNIVRRWGEGGKQLGDLKIRKWRQEKQANNHKDLRRIT